MEDNLDKIQFKAINNGIGFYQDIPQSKSFYRKDDEHQLLPDIFHGLDPSPDLYNQLIQRLEDPILESLNQTLEDSSSVVPKKAPPPYNLSSRKKSDFSEFKQESPLNKKMFLPSIALKIDFLFSIGLYLFTWVMIGVLFSSAVVPPLLFIALSFGLFHQLYVVICRSLIGCTLGEERCNISWSTRSPLYFILRGFLVSLTGFILIPICSALLGRDLLEDYTGIHPQYNI